MGYFFGKIGPLFIPTSGHTVTECKTSPEARLGQISFSRCLLAPHAAAAAYVVVADDAPVKKTISNNFCCLDASLVSVKL